MKKGILLILTVMLCMFLCACGNSGASGKGKNIASGEGWIVDSEGVLIVSDNKEHKIPNYTYSETAPWHPYRMLIKEIKIGEGITHIGELAFNSCEKAVTVELPSTLIQIADTGFSWCKSLKEITIPDSVEYIGDECFLGCESLEMVDWSNNLDYIPEGTFNECSSLKNVTLPESIRYIRKEAFRDCTSLELLVLPDKVAVIDDTSFDGCESLVIKCKEGTETAEYLKSKNFNCEIVFE